MQKLWVKTLECTEQSGKIPIPQSGERVCCSVHPSYNVNAAQKQANFRDTYACKKINAWVLCHLMVLDSGHTRQDLSVGV